jgi:hypothetical protein
MFKFKINDIVYEGPKIHYLLANNEEFEITSDLGNDILTEVSGVGTPLEMGVNLSNWNMVKKIIEYFNKNIAEYDDDKMLVKNIDINKLVLNDEINKFISCTEGKLKWCKKTYENFDRSKIINHMKLFEKDFDKICEYISFCQFDYILMENILSIFSYNFKNPEIEITKYYTVVISISEFLNNKSKIKYEVPHDYDLFRKLSSNQRYISLIEKSDVKLSSYDDIQWEELHNLH